VTDASQIEERLAIYEKIRRNRAATIQILSNFGFGDPTGLPEELVGFLEGHPIPSKSYFKELLQFHQAESSICFSDW
jgi:hypothetical protein